MAGFHLPDNFGGFFEADAGILLSEASIHAYRQLALKAGATLRTNSPVVEIHYSQDHVTVKTKHGETYHANKLIISAGAWNPKLLADLTLPLRPIRKTVSWFPTKEMVYDASRFPGFIIYSDIDKLYYGFPSINGCGIKIGEHTGGNTIDPDQLDRTYLPHSKEEQDLQKQLQTYFPQATPTCSQGKVCIYTMTPDEHFILNKHPEHPSLDCRWFLVMGLNFPVQSVRFYPSGTARKAYYDYHCFDDCF